MQKSTNNLQKSGNMGGKKSYIYRKIKLCQILEINTCRVKTADSFRTVAHSLKSQTNNHTASHTQTNIKLNNYIRALLCAQLKVNHVYFPRMPTKYNSLCEVTTNHSCLADKNRSPTCDNTNILHIVI